MLTKTILSQQNGENKEAPTSSKKWGASVLKVLSAFPSLFSRKGDGYEQGSTRKVLLFAFLQITLQYQQRYVDTFPVYLQHFSKITP